MQIRDWLYVEDHCEAILRVILAGRTGETYNVGGDNQPPNIEIVRTICAILDELQPDSTFRPHASLMTHVTDRPGHDRRYDVNIEKIGAELGWEPRQSLITGMRQTVAWYLDHPEWVDEIHQQSDLQSWMTKNYAERGGKK